jgi:hypothetical protein
MTSISHEPSARAQRPLSQVLVPEMWASLTIIVMWVAVLVDAIFGPNIESSNGVTGVGDSSTVPSAVVLALFAFLGTWVVAKYGFTRKHPD